MPCVTRKRVPTTKTNIEGCSVKSRRGKTPRIERRATLPDRRKKLLKRSSSKGACFTKRELLIKIFFMKITLQIQGFAVSLVNTLVPHSERHAHSSSKNCSGQRVVQVAKNYQRAVCQKVKLNKMSSTKRAQTPVKFTSPPTDGRLPPETIRVGRTCAEIQRQGSLARP